MSYGFKVTVDMSSELDAQLSQLLRLLGPESKPNLTALGMRLRDLSSMALTVKFFGYDLARKLAEDLPAVQLYEPLAVGLRSKPATQADLESDWAGYWLSQLKAPRIFHRKMWELAFVLQALWEKGMIAEGRRGLGFGCGHEPIPSYLAARGVQLTVTDIEPEQAKSKGWIDTDQHSTTIDTLFMKHLIDRPTFDHNISLRYVDMNAIPPDLTNYDFCWSICSLEHLGSIANGLSFVRNSLDTLRPGGVAVHTTEFNFLNDRETIDNWPTVLFQRQHFLELAKQLRDQGHGVAELDFDVGNRPMDKFIDIPPFGNDWPLSLVPEWSSSPSHVKLSIDGFASTCFGLIVTKRQ
jgi:2-polyprenyl-3-methyl-5-hydroxy-6-metoxy-1,4-benzoquinol methylase